MWIQTKGTGLKAGRSDAVDSTKWRFLRRIKRRNNEDMLYIVDFPHRWFAVEGISIDDFLSTYTCLGIREVKKITFIRDSVPCPKCCGWGRFDWLQTARGNGTIRHPRYTERGDFKVEEAVYHYMRQKHVNRSDGKNYKYVTSKPQLDETDKICDECFGSGIILQNTEGTVQFWNTLGYWYKKVEDV